MLGTRPAPCVAFAKERLFRYVDPEAVTDERVLQPLLAGMAVVGEVATLCAKSNANRRASGTKCTEKLRNKTKKHHMPAKEVGVHTCETQLGMASCKGL
eukprot:3941846-Rhodomonas_salina.3